MNLFIDLPTCLSSFVKTLTQLLCTSGLCLLSIVSTKASSSYKWKPVYLPATLIACNIQSIPHCTLLLHNKIIMTSNTRVSAGWVCPSAALHCHADLLLPVRFHSSLQGTLQRQWDQSERQAETTALYNNRDSSVLSSEVGEVFYAVMWIANIPN